jgi:hypothetical protein
MKFVIAIVALCAAVLPTIALPTPAPQLIEIDVDGIPTLIPTFELLPGKTKSCIYKIENIICVESNKTVLLRRRRLMGKREREREREREMTVSALYASWNSCCVIKQKYLSQTNLI